jgi:peptide/nickel transport system substrate-binding protein
MKDEYLKKQARWLSEGQIDRRQFIKAAIAAGLAVPSALTLATNVLAATPKKGGKLRYGFVLWFDHGLAGCGNLRKWHVAGYRLCARQPSDRSRTMTAPWSRNLQKALNRQTERKTWVFNLRKGVEFHNGKTLTADDVIATFNYHRDENSKSAAKGLLSAVTEIKKDGDNQVIFELMAAMPTSRSSCPITTS